MNDIRFQITAENAGARIDTKAAEISGFTRSKIQRLIEQGLLKVNGLAVRPNYRTRPGDDVLIIFPEEAHLLIPEDLPIDILYQDDFIFVVDKPPGMVVYPAAGHRSGTLMNAVAFHSRKLASVGGPLRPGVVHRLDKDTSGVMIVALDDRAYISLVEQFRQRTIKRKYIAMVYGVLKGQEGEISLRIGRSESDRKKMSTKVRRGKEAVTVWKVMERLKGATLIEVSLRTGRTHQIRVHFASVGHPVLGDRTYGRKTSVETGGRKIVFPRQMLHAALLGFIHPATNEYMEFVSPLPEDFENCLGSLRET
jgi:23S rRNA pseudouridine1911/1915/1917 synthase